MSLGRLSSPWLASSGEDLCTEINRKQEQKAKLRGSCSSKACGTGMADGIPSTSRFVLGPLGFNPRIYTTICNTAITNFDPILVRGMVSNNHGNNDS